jgi:hypothetical protein
MIESARRAVASPDYRQADYFRDELHRQIDLLNEHVRKCHAKLAVNTSRAQVDQIRHMQAQLRQCAIERSELLEMLAALTRRFPLMT